MPASGSAALYERIGGIDRSLGYAADYELFLRMALNGKCSYVPVAFSAFRRHAGQKSLAGAAAYRAEREAVRRRERDYRSATGLRKLAARASWRARMSMRARLAGQRWPRPDLAGTPVSKLSTGRYWPVGSS